MTKEELDAIRARCEAATPGPWGVEYRQDDPYFYYPISLKGPINADINKEGEPIREIIEMLDSDTKFIAHARQDIPALLDALEKSEARAKTLERAIR